MRTLPTAPGWALDMACDAAFRRVCAIVDIRCAAEHKRTREQAESARRSIGQLGRWIHHRGAA